MTPEQIAEVCHEANRAVTKHLGDVPVQASWDEADADMKASCVRGVEWRLANRDAPVSASHENWMKDRLSNGWVFGPEKNPVTKTHPALVPYEQLPDGVKRKDAIFTSIVLSLAPLLLALLLGAVLFAPAAALADTAPATPAPDSFSSLLLQHVLAPALAAIGGLLAWALTALANYLREKAKESKLLGVVAVLTESVRSMVAQLNTTLRPQLEAALADGVLTDAEKTQLKNTAIETVKKSLPAATLSTAKTIFGDFLDPFLGGLVERSVLDQKAVASHVNPPTP